MLMADDHSSIMFHLKIAFSLPHRSIFKSIPFSVLRKLYETYYQPWVTLARDLGCLIAKWGDRGLWSQDLKADDKN